jgi:hypothetical protein
MTGAFQSVSELIPVTTRRIHTIIGPITGAITDRIAAITMGIGMVIHGIMAMAIDTGIGQDFL